MPLTVADICHPPSSNIVKFNEAFAVVTTSTTDHFLQCGDLSCSSDDSVLIWMMCSVHSISIYSAWSSSTHHLMSLASLSTWLVISLTTCLVITMLAVSGSRAACTPSHTLSVLWNTSTSLSSTIGSKHLSCSHRLQELLTSLLHWLNTSLLATSMTLYHYECTVDVWRPTTSGCPVMLSMLRDNDDVWSDAGRWVDWTVTVWPTVSLVLNMSDLWMKWWRLLLLILLFSFFPFFIMVRVFTIPLPFLCNFCSFSWIFDSIHCRRAWNFGVIDLTIWKSCLEFLLHLLLPVPCTYPPAAAVYPLWAFSVPQPSDRIYNPG